MSKRAIEPGALVMVRTADEQELRRRAVTGVEEEGHDFPVVWITSEEEWAEAAANDHRPEVWPWPAEDVWVIEDSVAA